MNNEMNQLTPFKMCIIDNFPFIEEDFDAITNYQLLCKIVEYLNKVIANENELNKGYQYILNYFNNLDVQDEIDNKLDEMAESGELENIISAYLNVNCILSYNTIADLISATNINDGSFCKTYGLNNYNDGMGAFYKVRAITNDDVVDGINIIALDISDSLIAEKQKTKGKAILLSDSYFDWSPDETIDYDNRYWVKFFKMEGITDYQAYNKGGIGFYQKVDGVDFQKLLEDNATNITNKTSVDKIFVFGGYNDAFDNNTTIQNINDSIDDFVEYCKETYPNATVYIGEIGYDTNVDSDGTARRNKINNKVVPAYANTTYNSNNPYIYLPNLEYCLHNKDYMSSDGVHPNTTGHNALANAIYESYHAGFNQLPINEEYYSLLPADVTNEEITAQLYIRNTIPVKSIRINNFGLSYTASYPTLTHASGTAVAKFDTSKLLLPVYDIPFEVTALIGTTNTGYWLCPCKITFTSLGTITINTNLLNDTRSGWYDIENVNYIEIPAMEFTTTMDVL